MKEKYEVQVQELIAQIEDNSKRHITEIDEVKGEHSKQMEELKTENEQQVRSFILIHEIVEIRYIVSQYFDI